MNDIEQTQSALAEIRIEVGAGSVSYETARSADAAERIGAVLAARARAAGATAIVGFVDPDDSVVAHVVARELGVPRATIEEDLGLLTLSPELPTGSRVVLIGLAERSTRDTAGALSMLEGHGFELIPPLFADQLG
jgi:hypothetical protein